MSFYIIKNRFERRDFKQQSDIAADFILKLDSLVLKAAVAWLMHSFSRKIRETGKVHAYSELIGPGRENEFYMRSGSAIEAQTYYYLERWRKPANYQPDSLHEPGDYLIEHARSHGRLFPYDFSSPIKGEGSRPDIRVALGDGYEALYDITSEKSAGHVLKKGNGHWLSKRKVLLIAEIYYCEDEVAEVVSEMKL